MGSTREIDMNLSEEDSHFERSKKWTIQQTVGPLIALIILWS
mgnify:CR=1 FL=1|jgi:hypothetical protein